MPKVKFDGHICSLENNRYVYVSFRGNPFLAEIYQIPYLTLRIQSQDHAENRPKSN